MNVASGKKGKYGKIETHYDNYVARFWISLIFTNCYDETQTYVFL